MYILMFIGILFGTIANAQTPPINIGEEIDSALFIGEARIESYRDKVIVINTDVKPKQRVVKYALGSSWNPRELIRDDFSESSPDKTFSGDWPAAGSNILMIINRQNVVSLFGLKQGEEYRLWSPSPSDAKSIFLCEPPFKPLPLPQNKGLGKNESIDGCLAPLDFQKKMAAIEAAKPKPPVVAVPEKTVAPEPQAVAPVADQASNPIAVDQQPPEPTSQASEPGE